MSGTSEQAPGSSNVRGGFKLVRALTKGVGGYVALLGISMATITGSMYLLATYQDQLAITTTARFAGTGSSYAVEARADYREDAGVRTVVIQFDRGVQAAIRDAVTSLAGSIQAVSNRLVEEARLEDLARAAAQASRAGTFGLSADVAQAVQAPVLNSEQVRQLAAGQAGQLTAAQLTATAQAATITPTVIFHFAVTPTATLLPAATAPVAPPAPAAAGTATPVPLPPPPPSATPPALVATPLAPELPAPTQPPSLPPTAPPAAAPATAPPVAAPATAPAAPTTAPVTVPTEVALTPTPMAAATRTPIPPTSSPTLIPTPIATRTPVPLLLSFGTSNTGGFARVFSDSLSLSAGETVKRTLHVVNGSSGRLTYYVATHGGQGPLWEDTVNGLKMEVTVNGGQQYYGPIDTSVLTDRQLGNVLGTLGPGEQHVVELLISLPDTVDNSFQGLRTSVVFSFALITG